MEEKKKSLTQTRQKLVDMFLDILKSDEPLKWTSGWNSNRPKNAITDKEYRGINRMILMIQSMYEGYSDPRWCTFKQANDKGYRIKKGAKSTPVEFWSLYDKKTKKTLSYSEANKLETENPEYYAENVILMSKSYYVFNAEQIDGIPELEKAEDLILPEELEQFIDNIKKEMDISVIYGGNQAYYNVIKDEVHMPETNMFKGINEYYSTLLHELGHATGKDTRLNRNLSGTFGSENYAKEELRAEIASCFLTNDLGFNNEDDNEHNKNHAAYVKSWIRIVENSPMELMSAIKDAEIISGYLKEKGNYSEIFEKKNVLGENKLTKNSIIDNVPLMEPKSINIDNKSDLIRPEEKQELKKIDNTQYKYAILQIPLENPAGYNPKNYIDLETLRKNGDEPTGNDYEIIYIESTKEKPDLEKIYKRFNSGEVVPVNYYGTSVSMSDVIVTCENNSNMEVYYCDRFGFKKLDTPFLTDKIINNVKNNVDIRIEYEKLVNANITSGITGEELERIALIDKEYKSVFNMADRRKEGNTKVDLPFPDVKEVSEEIKGYNIDRNIEESDCKKITDKERSEKIMHQRMMLGRAR